MFTARYGLEFLNTIKLNLSHPNPHNNGSSQFIKVRHKPSVLLATRRKQRCQLVDWQQFLDSEVLCNLIGYLLDNVFNRLLYDRLHVRDQLPRVFIQRSISGFTYDSPAELQCSTSGSFNSVTVCLRHQVNVTTGASSLSPVPPSPAPNLFTDHKTN